MPMSRSPIGPKKTVSTVNQGSPKKNVNFNLSPDPVKKPEFGDSEFEDSSLDSGEMSIDKLDAIKNSPNSPKNKKNKSKTVSNLPPPNIDLNS
mmetsp:Transcript_32222/g.29092  ORF Transcript_32222/g.29092 Transcript_32222/m.29092 type:complete len:93 (-) Transcript_32222:477-755(-)